MVLRYNSIFFMSIVQYEGRLGCFVFYSVIKNKTRMNVQSECRFALNHHTPEQSPGPDGGIYGSTMPCLLQNKYRYVRGAQICLNLCDSRFTAKHAIQILNALWLPCVMLSIFAVCFLLFAICLFDVAVYFQLAVPYL